MSDSASCFYNNELPNVRDIVMCTVTEYTDAGFKVILDAYADAEGFIPLCELSSKRIKKNPATFLKIQDKHPVLVLDIVGKGSNIVELSLKDVQPDERELCQKNFSNSVKIYNMCQRLEHLTKTPENIWHDAFKNSMSNAGCMADPHLLDVIHSEQMINEGKSGLSKDLDDLLVKYHVQLFGFTTATLQKTLLIQSFRSDGSNYVKDILCSICPSDQKEDWVTEELNQDLDRYNLSIKLIGLPKILVTVTSCKIEKAEQVMNVVLKQLQAAKFNIFMEV
jgi:translation initiation factor 2 alpha subunit (eIF-2alpha)